MTYELYLILTMTSVFSLQGDYAARVKAQKVQLALDKIKEANIKKVRTPSFDAPVLFSISFSPFFSFYLMVEFHTSTKMHPCPHYIQSV